MIEEDCNANNYYVFADYTVVINDKMVKLAEISTKDVYWMLLEKKIKRPTSEDKWQIETGLTFDHDEWGEIYTNPYSLTTDTRILTFHFKIMHRILACKHNLLTWKIEDNDICKVCKVDRDFIEHHLVACPSNLQFWNSFFAWWKSNMSMSFPVDTYDILFGLVNPNSDIVILQLNFMMLHRTYYIYKSKQQGKIPELYDFLVEMKNVLDIKQANMTAKGVESKYNKTWAPRQRLSNII
jgi:hypothetical protein